MLSEPSKERAEAFNAREIAGRGEARLCKVVLDMLCGDAFKRDRRVGGKKVIRAADVLANSERGITMQKEPVLYSPSRLGKTKSDC